MCRFSVSWVFLLLLSIALLGQQPGVCKKPLRFSSSNNNLNRILDFDFYRDFPRFNPRSADSAFEFPLIDNTTGLRQDNAAFLLDSSDRILNMASVPFNHWLPQSFGLGASLAAYEAAARLADSIDIQSNEIFRISFEFNCRTFNVKLNPFPKSYVTNMNDDPRLASCTAGISDLTVTGLSFGVDATNTGIWAAYSRNAVMRPYIGNATNADSTYDTFEVYRHVAIRRNSRDVIKAVVELDRSLNQTRYYVNSRLVWVIGNWGVLTSDLQSGNAQGNRLISFSPGSTATANPMNNIRNITILLATTRKLAQADPNRSDNGISYSPGLVRLSNLPNLYNPDVAFYDNSSERYNVLFGQGAIMGLKRMRVEVGFASGISESVVDDNGNNEPQKNDNDHSTTDSSSESVETKYEQENIQQVVHPKQGQRQAQILPDRQDPGYGLNARQLARIQSQYEPEDASLTDSNEKMTN